MTLYLIGIQDLLGQSILPPLKDKLTVVFIVNESFILAKEDYDRTPTNSPDYTVVRSKFVILKSLKDLLSKSDWLVNDAIIASFGESFNVVYHMDDSVSGNLILNKSWPNEFSDILNLLQK